MLVFESHESPKWTRFRYPRYPQFHSMAPSIVSRDHHSPSPGPTDGNLSGARHLGGRSAVSSIGLLFIYRKFRGLHASPTFYGFNRDFESCCIYEFFGNFDSFCCTYLLKSCFMLAQNARSLMHFDGNVGRSYVSRDVSCLQLHDLVSIDLRQTCRSPYKNVKLETPKQKYADICAALETKCPVVVLG
jgi:hypothetical protein